MDAIEPGFYWVRWDGLVTLGQYITSEKDYKDSWLVIGDEQNRYSDEIQVISERLTPPESQFDGN